MRAYANNNFTQIKTSSQLIFSIVINRHEIEIEIGNIYPLRLTK